jgi:hypothetical protein
MHVYHCSLESKGFFTKTDRQPSGGGAIASPYLHDFTLNFAFYAALKNRAHVLPENPRHLEDLQHFFKELPVYAYPAAISRSLTVSETLNTLTENRGMPAIGNQGNVPKKNRWTGYKSFFAQTTVLSNVVLPSRFYLRLGKKRAPVLVSLKEVEAKRIKGESYVGIMSPIMHTDLVYTSGTLLRTNPSPLYIGKTKGHHVFYQTEGLLIYRPLQFRYFGTMNA